jgi:hypothetical protein
MTMTREDLVNRTLRKLGALPTGQPADPEDYEAVDGTVESVMSDLAKRNIWQWGDIDQIDEDAFEHLADLLSIANARDFGIEPSEQNRMLAESRLRQLDTTVLSGAPQTAEYF